MKRQPRPIPARRARPRRGPATIPLEEWRNAAYRRFLREEGRCVACLKEILGLWPQLMPTCDPAHTENNGMRSKGRDSSCVPLCRNHHREYDSGRVAFEKRYSVDMKVEAAVWWNLWLIFRESGL